MLEGHIVPNIVLRAAINQLLNSDRSDWQSIFVTILSYYNNDVHHRFLSEFLLVDA